MSIPTVRPEDLAGYSLLARVGEPYLVCPVCARVVWPGMTPDPDGELVRCDCGAEMRARRRREQS